jgi:serine/threonine protein phosphatase PrpC
MIRFAGKTDPGLRAGVNEDAIGWDTDHQLWFVADGVGGRAAGQMASGIVKETFLRRAMPASLIDTTMQAHTRIRDRATRESQCAGMASTVVCAQIHRTTCRIVWVGDSRAYLYRQRTLQRITRDHSFIELLRERESLTPAQIQSDPDRHRLSQSLGVAQPEPSLATVRLQHGDRLLLCTDGLTGELEDAAILETLQSHPLPEEAVAALIATALEHGGEDNISVIVMNFGRRWRLPSELTPKTVWLWLALASLGCVGAGAWHWMRKH